jgi:hypothetical protein
MTRDRSDRDAPGGGRPRADVAAQRVVPPGGGEWEQVERSEEPCALLRAAFEQPEEPERAGGAGD